VTALDPKEFSDTLHKPFVTSDSLSEKAYVTTVVSVINIESVASHPDKASSSKA